METNKKNTAIDIKQSAKEFMKKCHVFGLVGALEGGHIELDGLLTDFAKSDEVREYWINELKK